MKKLITAISVLILSATALNAQSQQISELKEKLSRNMVELVYEYTIAGLEENVITGTAAIQDNCFKIEGAGLKILCDGESIWTLDFEGQEAYVEKAAPLDFTGLLEDAEFTEDGRISGTWSEPSSGAIINITLSEIKYKNKSGNTDMFRPSPETFQGDWIITDLR